MTFTLTLDQTRTLCFDEAATDRFTGITGVNPRDLPALSEGPAIRNIQLLATLIWCSLSANDREALSHEKLSEFLTPKMLTGFSAEASKALWGNKEKGESPCLK